MNYYIDEITFNNQDWKDLGFASETWLLTNNHIETPHGLLSFVDFMFVEQNGLVGIQFDVIGSLSLGDFEGCPSHLQETEITTIAIMRQPNNVWLWAYLFCDGVPVATFCGHDDLDGFAHYSKELKAEYNL